MLAVVVNIADNKQQNGKRPRNIQESKVYNIKVQFDPSVIFKNLDKAPDKNFNIEDFIKNFDSPTTLETSVPSTTPPTTTSTTTTSTTSSTTSTTTTLETSTPITTKSTTEQSLSITEKFTISSVKNDELWPSLALNSIDDQHSDKTTDIDTHTADNQDKGVKPVKQENNIPASTTVMVPGTYMNYITPYPVYQHLPLLYYFGQYQPASKSPVKLNYFWPVPLQFQSNIYGGFYTTP